MSELAALHQARVAEAPRRQRALVDYLRAMVLAKPSHLERFHAIFLDESRSILGDAPLGQGRSSNLTVRMREIFERALVLQSSAIVIAHNHPSGLCRPSEYDLHATMRLKQVAEALDIELLDHLIITYDAVYSMRAGGNL